MPTDKHQAILDFLFVRFREWLLPRHGRARTAGLRVRIADARFRQPDITVLLDAEDPRRQDSYWLGADLVVEVVSPDDPQRDLVQKRQDYAEAGITEYWVVDPATRTILVLTLLGARYVEHGRFRPGDVATSRLLDGFAVDVVDVLDAD